MEPTLPRLTFCLLTFGSLAASPPAQPPPERSPGRVERLVSDLDHDRFQVREAATAELKRLGYEANAIRVGFIHYNTADEVDRFVSGLASAAGAS